MEPTVWWLSYLAIGAAVGAFAGMLGIGGSMLTIPLLAIVLEAQGMPREHVVHVAVGTAMATIVFTSLSSMWSHARRGGVRWEIVRRMTPGILLGGVLGATAAGLISARMLALYFTAFVFLMALNLALDLRPKPARRVPGPFLMFSAGLGIGALSALTAIGGAVMTVPFMLYSNVSMIQAIGTAAAIGLPIAIGGTIGYLASGWSASGLAQGTIGYVYLPALVGIAVAGMLTAPIGAVLAHRLPAKTLRLVFALFLFVLAARMLINLW